MKPLIYYRKNKIQIDKSILSEWIVKAPTRRNRLDRGGSAGLRMDEKYDLQHSKKGIVFIDYTENAYVMMPKELLTEPEGKECNGVKNSIFKYDVNRVVNENNLEIIPIPHEEEMQAPYKIGLAGEIRKRFGL